MKKFSLLMSVYKKENPQFFLQCIKSILAQTDMPDEWIIIKDGPLTEDLEIILDYLRFPNELKIIALPENVTQGPARAAGVEVARNEWVAIMDSDDVCLPDRFNKQLKMIEENPELDLIGGQIAEFTGSPEHTVSIRHVPVDHKEIIKFAKKRNPFNSMTVMFKRDVALAAGNYRYFPGFEDYDLWVRMIINGATGANHPDVLVNARVGSGMYARRRGLKYIRAEWRMQKQLKTSGFIDGFELARNTVVRVPVRLLPEKGLERAYNRFARTIK